MDAVTKFNEAGDGIEGSKLSNMFGVKCYKIGRKPFILFHEEMIVCKLFGEEHSAALALEGSVLFAPMDPDKPMKNWVQIPYQHHKEWAEYAVLAHDYVMQGR